MSVSKDEGLFLSGVAQATLDEPLPRVTWIIYLLLAVIVTGVLWASVAKVDMVTKAEGRIVPDGKEQVITSLDSGILAEMLVREGDQVKQGQDLVRLDPTRVESQQNEGQLRRVSLRAMAARLQAEAAGKPLEFPADLAKAYPQLVAAETEAFDARRRVVEEAVGSLARSQGLLQRELNMSQSMAAKGLMSDVEVMRLSRQVNELQAQRTERVSRFRQEASGELVRVQNELAVQDEQMVVRKDALTRTVLKSPVNGLVKNIRVNTVGGVIGSGSPIMEIVPIGDEVLIEARLKPADVGFIHVGQRATVKLSGYDYNTIGGLKGEVEYISPDSLGDGDPKADQRYYRATVRSYDNNLRYKGEPLPVIPGMSASVEIKTGERSVLSFVLRPLMKSQEALRER